MSPGWVSVWCVLLRLQGVVPAKQGGAEQRGNMSKDTQAVVDSQPAPVPLAATAPLLWGWTGQREAGGSGVICVSRLCAGIQNIPPAILETCRSLSSGTDKSLGVLL